MAHILKENVLIRIVIIFMEKKLEGILPYVQLDTMKTDLMMIISELIPV